MIIGINPLYRSSVTGIRVEMWNKIDKETQELTLELPIPWEQ
jgi:hypothetical protein